MSALSVPAPYPTFAGTDGQPLDNGYIWIGVANLSPQVNPIPVYWDEALTIPAVQPIRTSGGYPVYQGTPSRLYVESNYSIQVLDSKGSVIYTLLNESVLGAGVFTSLTASGAVTFTGTGAMKLNAGTTEERPSPTNGMLRYNTTTSLIEAYIGGSWTSLVSGTAVTSVATGTGLTGGPITSTGTIAIDSTVATLTGTQTLTNKTIQGGSITSGTAVASTSGTSIDFTGIPSWVKRVTVMFNNVSLSGTATLLFQIGAGSIANTGYAGNSSYSTGASGAGISSTSGFPINNTALAVETVSGTAIFSLLNSSTGFWVMQFVGNLGTAGYFVIGSGSKTLSGTLDRVRLTTSNGTDTFDAGSINILYE
jgi:hypothetical protein